MQGPNMRCRKQVSMGHNNGARVSNRQAGHLALFYSLILSGAIRRRIIGSNTECFTE